ncbi:transcriptional regulator, AraC family with amidase-like domain [Actinopolyspora lacussalsi subsp. righensis]|uniref:Transcriptional regulator, AraC family with amidase-like domain n=2 Tax=Actinopolyspora righensis TaxID=995060 RepID=A0A1I6ZFU3_9ACTN|nr:transcriptional regulator, AraC family with amidase-like domain [Actinopolyspora righensis]
MLPMHQISVLALPEVVLFDLAIPLEVFGSQPHRYTTTVCAATPGPVPGTGGVPVHAGRGLTSLAEADTVIVPGFDPRDVPAREVLTALHDAAERGARMVSICTGAFALAPTGLLDQRSATTHWYYTEELSQRYPRIQVDPDVLYIDHDDIATSAGMAAGIDLCLHLVRRDHGADAATDIARRMVVPPHRRGGQAQLLDRPLPPSGDTLAETCAWAREHLDQRLTVADLARHAGYAPRTFARHFRAQTGTTPLRWLTAQRIHQARRLLEHTDRTVADIARSVGLGTAANLRTRLARDAHTSPNAYRRTYQESREPHYNDGDAR